MQDPGEEVMAEWLQETNEISSVLGLIRVLDTWGWEAGRLWKEKKHMQAALWKSSDDEEPQTPKVTSKGTS